MEIFRKKNVATRIVFSMIEAATPANFLSGETVTAAGQISDNEAAFSALAIAGSVSEIGTTGLYELALLASEVNHEITAIKFTSALAEDQIVIIRTRLLNQAHATPVFNEDSDSLRFAAFLTQEGEIVQSGLTSCTIEVFDDTHASLFSISTTSQTNGIFILTKTTPGLAKNRVYYFTISIVTTGGTFKSMDGIITIE